jgi:Ca2+-binding RTX toxin-like protein
MRMNTTARGDMTVLDTIAEDLANTDVMAPLPTTAVQTGSTGPTYSGINGAVRDSVLGTGAIVGQYVEGTQGHDTLYGTERADDMFGLGGHDSLYGGAGNDRLSGGSGNDMLHGGAGADVLDGGEGGDTASYAGSSAVTVNLAFGGLGGDAQGDTYIGIENVMGSNFADTIIGDAFHNTLNGGAGDDHLQGGAGGDTLIGGAGFDTLTGGEGQDIFVVTPNTGIDFITDFEQGLDKIDLTAFPRTYGDTVFGTDDTLAIVTIDWANLDVVCSHNFDWSDNVFFDTTTQTLYECQNLRIVEITGERYELTVGAALVKVDLHTLQTSDFMLA